MRNILIVSFVNFPAKCRFKPADWYATLEKYKVNVWFNAPTAFRMLMREGNELPKRYDLCHLRHILSVGEPLNPEVIRWGIDFLERRIHDNWWMTDGNYDGNH